MLFIKKLLALFKKSPTVVDGFDVILNENKNYKYKISVNPAGKLVFTDSYYRNKEVVGAAAWDQDIKNHFNIKKWVDVVDVLINPWS